MAMLQIIAKLLRRVTGYFCEQRVRLYLASSFVQHTLPQFFNELWWHSSTIVSDLLMSFIKSVSFTDTDCLWLRTVALITMRNNGSRLVSLSSDASRRLKSPETRRYIAQCFQTDMLTGITCNACGKDHLNPFCQYSLVQTCLKIAFGGA